MQEMLGMNRTDTGMIIRANPFLLESKVDLSLERKLARLTNRLHFGPSDVILVGQSSRPSMLR